MDGLTALSLSPLLDDVSRRVDFHRAAQSICRTCGSEVILADPTLPDLVPGTNLRYSNCSAGSSRRGCPRG